MVETSELDEFLEHEREKSSHRKRRQAKERKKKGEEEKEKFITYPKTKRRNHWDNEY